MSHEFDHYAESYESQHRESIKFSGEEPEYFANYKVKILASLAKQWNLIQPSILNYGSGIGNSIPALRKYFPDSLVINADVSSKSLQISQSNYGGDESYLLVNNGHIPVENGSFDIVFVACVFHHIPRSERIECLQELKRVTSKNGRIVTFEHNPWNPLTRHAVASCPFDVNADLISAVAFRRIMRDAGWLGLKTNYCVFLPAFFAKLRWIEPYLSWCPLGGQYYCTGRTST